MFELQQHYNYILKGIKMAENTEKKEVKTKKTTTAKAAAKPKTATAPKKASTAKTTTAKKTKAAASNLEQRYRMIEVAAYYIAEKDGFAGSPVDYWIAAELQISK